MARHLDKPTHIDPQLSTDVQKVRNFDPALAAGHPSRWARRQAHAPYTSDAHDVAAAGVKGIYQDFVGAPKGSGGYEVAAMTGRRGAMRQSVRAGKRPKQGGEPGEAADPRTSSEYQENIWTGRRPPNAPTQHRVPGVGTGRQALIEPGPNKTERISPLGRPRKEEEK